MQLQLAQEIPSVYTLGPGERYGIWVQGCPFRCKGCWNPNFLTFSTSQKLLGYETSTYDLASRIAASKLNLGISGGEPMSQAAALYELIDILKTSFNWNGNIVIFTGYDKKSIYAGTDGLRFALECDLLVCGLFEQDKIAGATGLLGSTNQEYWFPEKSVLTLEEINEARMIELQWSDGQLLLSGFPTELGTIAKDGLKRCQS